MKKLKPTEVKYLSEVMYLVGDELRVLVLKESLIINHCMVFHVSNSLCEFG